MAVLVAIENHECRIAVVADLLAEWRPDLHLVERKPVTFPDELDQSVLVALESGERALFWKTPGGLETGHSLHFTNPDLSEHRQRSEHQRQETARKVLSVFLR